MRLFGKKESKELVIYTMKGCDYCDKVREALTEKNIEFVEKLTNEWQEEWDKIIGLTNIPTTPTIYYKNSYFMPGRDFSNPQHLLNILKNFKNSEFSESRQALEQIKTLNYNMSTAFGRLDQLLRQIEKNYRELFEDEETKTE